MPLVQISLRTGKPDDYRAALMDGVYRAMRDTFNVPEDDQFITVSEHAPGNFRYGARYMDIQRSDDLVYIRITAMNTRSPAQKLALFRRLAEILAEEPGLRPEDVFVTLVETERENWSLGHGLAQYA